MYTVSVLFMLNCVLLGVSSFNILISHNLIMNATLKQRKVLFSVMSTLQLNLKENLVWIFDRIDFENLTSKFIS